MKLLFSFCTNAKLKDIAGSVYDHYHVFHVPLQFYFCKEKFLNRLLITHDPRLCKHCITSDPLTLPQGKLTCLGNTQGVQISQFALC